MHQQSILLLFLVLAGIATIVFTYLYASTKNLENSENSLANPLKKRFWFSLILFVILGIFASVTIPKSPYYLFADENPAMVVHVMTRQFGFVFSENAIDPKKPAGESIEIPVNELVEFRVTSMDVNHGFAIYDDSHRLIIQTQAMPGYVNRLRFKFDHPGKYDILCLEYCGLAHHVMKSSFHVK